MAYLINKDLVVDIYTLIMHLKDLFIKNLKNKSMLKRNVLTGLILTLAMSFITAQKFIEPAKGLSVKKTAYLTLADGSKLEGKFRSGKASINGGYKTIVFKTMDGEKLKLDAIDVKSILIPQSSLGALAESMDQITDASQWGDDAKINEDAVKEGYYYYETVVIAKKKKDVPAVRQILNPGYADQIKVMTNEMAMKGPSASLGGIKVAEANASSYFIKVGDDKAMKVKAGKYQELFSQIYAACPEFIEKYKDDIKWKDLEKHVFEFSQMCQE